MNLFTISGAKFKYRAFDLESNPSTEPLESKCRDTESKPSNEPLANPSIEQFKQNPGQTWRD